MNWHVWIGRAFRALVGSEQLPRDSCLKACALLGAWAGLAAAGALFLAAPQPDMRQLALKQLSVALAIITGAALSWLWPPATRLYLVLAGVTLVATVVWYPSFMTGALAARRVKRFAHAPGVLAFGLAFGLRLLLDVGIGDEDTRREAARTLGIAGLVIGGSLDVFVMYRMFGSL